MTTQTTRESLDIVTRYAKHVDERIAAAKLDQKLGACKHGCIPARACYSLECSPKIVTCGERVLAPDDVIAPCVLPQGHAGYHDTGR